MSTKTDVDFSHRLELPFSMGFPLDSSTIYSTVNMMTDRATAVLLCLNNVVEAGRIDNLPDGTLQHLISTVLNEIRDIDSTVNAWSCGQAMPDE